jgi:hypothetical protein
VLAWGITSATGAPEANRFLRRDCIAPPCTGKPQRGGLTRAPGPPSCLARPSHHYLSNKIHRHSFVNCERSRR